MLWSSSALEHRSPYNSGGQKYSPASPRFPTPNHPSKFGTLALLLLCVATWSVSHGYLGLFHDAGLYTLQALARLYPDSLSHDVFLQFGSQDQFTLFSPLYAQAIRLLGVEPAAAILTLLFQIALIGGAWALARSVMPPAFAWIGAAVFVAIPGDYGADRIFTCMEPFLTPRMAAEALTLGSLAAAMSSRRLLSFALFVAAALIHPVMAGAGLAALLWLHVGLPRPTWSLVLIAAGMLTIAAEAFIAPNGTWGRFDDAWLRLVNDRSPYLFLANWHLDDWSSVAVSAGTVALAQRALPDARARRLCLITLLTVSCGLLLTLIACDGLHLVLFTELQPWRWQWLSTVVAALMLPTVLYTLWRGDVANVATTTTRTAALLLIAAWVFASNVYALAAAVGALITWAFLNRLKPSEARWFYWGAYAFLTIALVWRIASNLQFTEAHYLNPNIPLWIRRTMSFTRDGNASLFFLALIGCAAQIRRALPVLLMLAALAAGACVVLLPHTWRSWTAQEFSAQQIASFASFRQHIPPDSTVFWPESTLQTWVLLQRPSYISVLQTSGMVFSRSSALELDRRAATLGSAVSPAEFMNWANSGKDMTLSRLQLTQVCGTGAFDFLVTGADLNIPPVSILATGGPAAKSIRLYRCTYSKSTN